MNDEIKFEDGIKLIRTGKSKSDWKELWKIF